MKLGFTSFFIGLFLGAITQSLLAQPNVYQDSSLTDIEELIRLEQWTTAEASLLKYIWFDPYGKEGIRAAELLSRLCVMVHKAPQAMEWLEIAIANQKISVEQQNILKGRLELLQRLYIPGQDYRLDTEFQLTGSELESPQEIIVTPDDDLVVLDRYKLLIFSETKTGSYKLKPPTFPLPDRIRSLKLRGSSPLVVLENGYWLDNRIYNFQGPLELTRIIDAVITSNNKWMVLDRRNTNMVCFDIEGNFLDTIPAFPPNGNERLIKHSSNGCWVLTPSLRQVATIGTTPVVKIPFKGSNYNLTNPIGMATDWFGHLYVLNQNKTVAIFSPRGVCLKTVALDPKGDILRSPTDISIGPDGRIFIADRRRHEIFCYR